MTVASIGAQIVERTLYRLEALTLDLAPTGCRPETDTPNGFARHNDRTCKIEQVTDPGRLRLIEAALVTPTTGQEAMSSTVSSFTKLLRIRVGYPMEEWETINGTEYGVEDLKQHDFEQIDRAIIGGALGAAIDVDHPEIPVVLARLGGAAEYKSGRCVDLFYEVQYERAYP